MEGSKRTAVMSTFFETAELISIGQDAQNSSIFIGDSTAPNIQELNIPQPITIFGSSSSPSSTSRVIFQGFSVIIGFFTQDLQVALSEEVDTATLLLLLFLLFIVWKVASDKFLEWFIDNENPSSMKNFDYQLEWRDDVVNWIYFVSYVIVYLLFGYLSRLIFSTASDFGFTFNELVLLTAIAIPFLVDIYRKAWTDIIAHK